MMIGKDFSLNREDKYNIVLRKHKIKGKDAKIPGEEYSDVVGYYGTLESALNKVLELSIDTKDVLTILKSLEDIKNQILIALKNKKDN